MRAFEPHAAAHLRMNSTVGLLSQRSACAIAC
jgi:hypothetical protein